MNVGVNFFVGKFNEEEDDRKNRRRKNVAIGLSERVLYEAVFDQTLVYEDVDRVTIEFLDLRLRDEAVHADFARLGFFVIFVTTPGRGFGEADALEIGFSGDAQQLIESSFTEDLVDAL